ncbi:MAG TPA: isoprenylcysteine carboxylmethyltransferase family protein [Candidatus Saccharimonadales bacterium]|nr:isoprenylcysteine carboxylmethyltransferase family protein [Candidatus Saccharimonadales bacterium]
MLELAKFIVFSLLSIRYFYWVASLLEKNEFSLKIFISEFVEMGFLLFLLTQYLVWNILPMQVPFFITFLGFLLVVVSLSTAFLAKKQLGIYWVPAILKKIVKKQPLLTSGIYAYLRHPIYAGVIFSYVGAEIVAGSWLWVSSLCLLIPIYLQAKKEEKLLTSHFGKQYQEYMKHTKMLIPFVL